MAIVKGDLLSGSEKLARCELLAAGFYGWFISNQAATDDFGRGRLAPAGLWAKVFEKRIDRGLVDVTPALIAAWFAEWERVGLVRVYLWSGEVWFEWVKFQGVAPTKQRYHRAPEPPWSSHVCVYRCQRSAKKYPKLLMAVECTTADAFGSRTADALGTYSVPSVFRSPPSSVPLRPLQTDLRTTAPGPRETDAGPGPKASEADEAENDLPGPPPPTPTNGNGATTTTQTSKARHKHPEDPWPTGEAIADYEARNGAGSAPGGEIAGQLTPLVRGQARAAGLTACVAWATLVRPSWRAYWGLEPGAPATHPNPSAADFRKHFGARGSASAERWSFIRSE